MFLNDAVLYVNPYMVVTPKGYTKHYYNGSQRIAAQIGKLKDLPNDIIDTSAVAMERIANARAYMDAVLNISEIQTIDTTSVFADIEGDALDELQWQCNDEEWTLNATVHCDSNLLYPILIKDTTNLDKRVSGIFYYHSDQLGSATWITNDSGSPVEFIHYMPFGELWYNQQASAYNERFKFTGKERDTETGYDYFGARYYSSALPMWLSVDPLADKYPNISPYAYCNWNPVKYIDPDGNEVIIAVPPTQKKHYNAARNYQKYSDTSSSITLIAHGATPQNKSYATGILVDDKILRGASVADYIRYNSVLWKEHTTEGALSIILSACYTGKEGKQMDGSFQSFGQQLSKELKQNYQGDIYVTAPEGAVYIETGLGGILGDLNILGYPYIDGTYMDDSKSVPSTWNVYKNGEFIKSIKQIKVPTINQILE